MAVVALAVVLLLLGAGPWGLAPNSPPACVFPYSTSARATRFCSSPAHARASGQRGTAGGGAGGNAARRRVERLGAAIVTHDQSDHAGGIRELFGAVPITRLLYGASAGPTLAAASRAGIPARRLAGGAAVRSGRLRLEVLWPPPELLSQAREAEDPNALALVIRARWRDFTMLLTADAEAEATRLDPGPVDVLKVAHHGSDDAGLAGLLERTRPRLAVISAGAGNPFGHPTPGTLDDPRPGTGSASCAPIATAPSFLVFFLVAIRVGNHLNESTNRYWG